MNWVDMPVSSQNYYPNGNLRILISWNIKHCSWIITYFADGALGVQQGELIDEYYSSRDEAKAIMEEIFK